MQHQSNEELIDNLLRQRGNPAVDQLLTSITDGTSYPSMRDYTRQKMGMATEEPKEQEITGPNQSALSSVPGGHADEKEKVLVKTNPNTGFMDAWFLGLITLILEPIMIYVAINLFR